MNVIHLVQPNAIRHLPKTKTRQSMSKKQFTFVRMAGRLSTRITNTNGHVVFSIFDRCYNSKTNEQTNPAPPVFILGIFRSTDKSYDGAYQCLPVKGHRLIGIWCTTASNFIAIGFTVKIAITHSTLILFLAMVFVVCSHSKNECAQCTWHIEKIRSNHYMFLIIIYIQEAKKK